MALLGNMPVTNGFGRTILSDKPIKEYCRKANDKPSPIEAFFLIECRGNYRKVATFQVSEYDTFPTIYFGLYIGLYTNLKSGYFPMNMKN